MDYYRELRKTLMDKFVGERRDEYLGTAKDFESRMIINTLRPIIDIAVTTILHIVREHNEKFKVDVNKP